MGALTTREPFKLKFLFVDPGKEHEYGKTKTNKQKHEQKKIQVRTGSWFRNLNGNVFSFSIQHRGVGSFFTAPFYAIDLLLTLLYKAEQFGIPALCKGLQKAGRRIDLIPSIPQEAT